MNKNKEIQEIYNYLWTEVDGYDLSWESDCAKLAERLYKDGWRRKEKTIESSVEVKPVLVVEDPILNKPVSERENPEEQWERYYLNV